MTQDDLRQNRVYNIVLFGETQSGKSTFVEAARKYADRSYNVDFSLIGNGIESHTTKVHVTTISTDLPIYEVYNTADGSPVKYADYVSKFSNLDEYQEAIDQRKNLDIRKSVKEDQDNTSRAGIPTRHFNIFDTPGLNDSNMKDETHVTELFRQLRHEKTIDMVLLLVAPGPFHPNLVSAINFYVSMFPEFNGIFAFIHTRTRYELLHPKNTEHSKLILESKRNLQRILGRTTTSHFMIDCDFEANRPIRECITLSTIWKILSLAEFNRPISIETMTIYKTPRMEQVDSIVNDTCIQLLQEQQSTLRFKNESEGELLKRVCQLESKILKNASKRRDAREYIRRYNTGDLYLLHETRFDGGWDTKPLWYPFTLHSGTLEHAIAEFSVLGENVSFRCDFGGKNQSYYVMFRLMQKQDAYVHVKAFIQKKRIFQQEIENYKDKLRKYARTHEILVNNLREYPVNDEKYKSIKPIFDTQRKYLELQRLMSSSTVSPEILAALLEADVYSGTLSECAAKVERVYLDCISKGLVTEGDDKVGEFGIFGGLSGNEGGEHHSAIGELDDCINFDRTQSNTNIYSIAPKPMDAPPLLSKSYLAWISGIGIFKSSEKKLVSCATIQSKNELK